MFIYQISIYNIINYLEEESLLIDAKPLKKTPKIFRVLIITKAEMAVTLGLPLKSLQQNLDKVIDLVIIEGNGEISLCKRILNDNTPVINIITTKTDQFNDQYKQYSLPANTNIIKSKPVTFVNKKIDTIKAAVMIQKIFRGKKQRKKYQELKISISKIGLNNNIPGLSKAIMIIQKYCRRWKAKKKYNELKEKSYQSRLLKAVTLIQSMVRR